MSTTRDTLRKAIEAYTAEGPNDGPNDGHEEKALAELLDAIEAYDDTRDSPVGPHWARVMAAVPVLLTASADQVRDLRVAWEAFEAEDKRQDELVESMLAEFATPDPAERKPVAGWAKRSAVLSLTIGAHRARVALGNWVLVTESAGTSAICMGDGAEETDEAAQLAAEDALRNIADQIYAALRGGS